MREHASDLASLSKQHQYLYLRRVFADQSASKYALDQVKAGTFKAETIVLDSKADGVGFSDKNTELGADIVAKVNDVKAKIISGEVKVIPTYAEAKAAKVVPDNLQASDK